MEEKTPVMTDEIRRVLRRYVEIQEQERRLREEKAELQDTLRGHMVPAGCSKWLTEAGGERLNVVCNEYVEIHYDDKLLRERLGDRFPTLLSPDIRKIRASLSRLEGCLAPVLAEIGSVDPERVRAAIESGHVTKEDFRGAFTRTRKHRIAVRRPKPDDSLHSQPNTHCPLPDTPA